MRKPMLVAYQMPRPAIETKLDDCGQAQVIVRTQNRRPDDRVFDHRDVIVLAPGSAEVMVGRVLLLNQTDLAALEVRFPVEPMSRERIVELREEPRVQPVLRIAEIRLRDELLAECDQFKLG